MSHDETILQGPQYWTTLSEYHQDEEFLAVASEEFYPSAKPERYFDNDETMNVTPMQRRTFLKLGGFAALAAAVAGCERPVSHVLPYVKKPEEAAFNESLYYASTCTECAAACGLLVKTKVGRPIKLEGNPDHPMNRGALCTRGQGSIMNLYDPDRLRRPSAPARKGVKAAPTEKRMADYDQQIGSRIARAKGKVVLLTPTLSGPSNARLVRSFLDLGNNFQHVQYDPLGPSGEKEALKVAFGQDLTPRYDFAKADVVLCLGGDPVGQSVSKVETQAGFAARRRPTEEGMSRVYVFEPHPTLTGMAADYRKMVRPDQLLPVGLAIAKELIDRSPAAAAAADSRVTALLAGYSASAVASVAGLKAEDITRVAASLAAARGKAIVHTSSSATATAEARGLHLLGIFLNQILDSYSATIDLTEAPSKQFEGGLSSILELIEEMKAGRVEVLLISGVNPAYTLPKSVGFADAMAKVGLSVSYNLRFDETTALCDLSLPQIHGLESWGDAEPHAGLFSIQQPVINVLFGPDAAEPMLETRAWQESLMAAVSAAGRMPFVRTVTAEDGSSSREQMSWYDFVRQTWERSVFRQAGITGDDAVRSAWIDLLRSGIFDVRKESAKLGRYTSLALASTASAAMVEGFGAASRAASGGRYLVALASNIHGDGQSMSNPLLLEMPDAVSKICWDNHASISPELAASLRVKDGDILSIELPSGTIEAPAFIQPGMQKEAVAIQLGWGRNTFDGIGDGIGTNVWPVTALQAGALVLSGLPIKGITRTGRSTKLANVQGHNYMFSPELILAVNKRKGEAPEGATVNASGKPVYERPIVGETTWNEWKVNKFAGYPNSVDPGQQVPSIWERSHKYVGHHWGMAIDLNACNGCGACMVACSVENNVPVVGKDEVAKGREMHWIRIDRYYRGTPDDPDFVQQILMCQHCDNAPCETVCPVIATMHNDEGLNVMTYNRCVGTRYCANNCPYKVRRFNFWQYSDWRTGPYDNVKRVSPLEMVLNPEVSTRTRGVMEKCTFCSHRIRVAKDKARERGERLPDGAMLTACQQTCPTKAIIFGDRNDRNSEVSKAFQDPRAYGLLADVNTDPSVRYLTLVRNRDEKSPYRTKYQAKRQDHKKPHAGH